jgi:hypothetical protein
MSPSRQSYYDTLIARISTPRESPWVVFLDPDTGIAPGKTASPQHVTADETRRVFNALHTRDVLVFYQHARHTKKWQEETQQQLADAIGRTGGIRTFTGPTLAKDVAFFVAVK